MQLNLDNFAISRLIPKSTDIATKTIHKISINLFCEKNTSMIVNSVMAGNF